MARCPADLIVGREENRLGRRRGLGGADRVGEIAPDQRASLLVVRSQFGESLVRIDPGQAEQGRDQVGVARRHVELANAAGQKRTAHDKRHMQCLLVGDVPFLMHPIVRALQVAVIRREDHDCVLVRLARLQRVEHLGDLLIDRGL